MLTILSVLLTVLPLSFSDPITYPICQDPPPDSTMIPTLSHCQGLVGAIFTLGLHQRGEPVLYTEDPSQRIRSYKVPFSFHFPLLPNECEFHIEEIVAGGDIFPTRLLAEGAQGLVENCMERGIDGAATLGRVTVGPRGAIDVVLRKKGHVDGGVHLLDLTNVQLSKPGSLSRPSPSLVEDR